MNAPVSTIEQTDPSDVEDVPFTDAELTELALAAEPTDALDDDAVPLNDPTSTDELLPSWYMPAARAGGATSGRRMVAAIIILAFLVVNALGFCITYGVLEIA